MDRLNWDDIRLFLALARDGTLSGAARNLGLGVATVSRRVERIEHHIGLPLFLRHQQGYDLTDQGAALLPKAEAMELAAHAMRREADTQMTITGRVRLASIESLVAPFVVPSLAPLLAANPDLDIEVGYSPATVNLHRHDADLALRMVAPRSGNLVVRRLAVMGFGLYGPADGTLPERQVTWPEIASLGVPLGWSKTFATERRGQFAANTLQAQVAAVRAGIGVGVLPHFLARSEGLRMLADNLPQGGKMERPVLLATHADLTASRRVRAVADAVADAIDAHRHELEGVR